jgi:hypothetical protein
MRYLSTENADQQCSQPNGDTDLDLATAALWARASSRAGRRSASVVVSGVGGLGNDSGREDARKCCSGGGRNHDIV